MVRLYNEEKIMKKLLLLALVVFLPISAHARRNTDFYWQLTGHFVFADDADVSGGSDISFDEGFGLGGSVGAYLGNDLRMEFELAIRETGEDGGGGRDVSSTATMLNFIYDVDLSAEKFVVRPYLGLGVGLARIDIDGLGGEEQDDVAALQAMFGLNFDLDYRSSLILGYKYFYPKDWSRNGMSVDYTSHDIEVGFRRQF